MGGELTPEVPKVMVRYMSCDDFLDVAAPGITRPSGKVVMTAQVQQPQVKPHLIAKSFQDCRLETPPQSWNALT